MNNGAAIPLAAILGAIVILAIAVIPLPILNASIAKRKGKSISMYGWLSIIPPVGLLLSIYLISLMDREIVEKINLILKNTKE